MPDNSSGSASSQASVTETQKRKRDEDEGGRQLRRSWIPQPQPPQSSNEASINYLEAARHSKLKLVQGDSVELLDIIQTIDAYEGVLNSHEALASHLGAQMTTPRLAKAIESLFQGTIELVDEYPTPRPEPSWMDVTAFAKANPAKFTLTTTPSGSRVCQFKIRGYHCTINENDWRLIVTGAFDRFGVLPLQGSKEDEEAELATVEIVEERLQMLIKNADKVAEKARQLSYQLSKRKAGIKSRQSRQSSTQSPLGGSHSRDAPAVPAYDLKADLLQQFTEPTKPAASVMSTTDSPRNSERGGSVPWFHSVDGIMYSRVEPLPKGWTIVPRCDLCRKRNKDCIKNRSACEACTKKHAKCTWHNVTPDEAWFLTNSVPDPSVADSEPPEALTGTSVSRPVLAISGGRLSPLRDDVQHLKPPFDANSLLVRRSAAVRSASSSTLNRRAAPEPDADN